MGQRGVGRAEQGAELGGRSPTGSRGESGVGLGFVPEQISSRISLSWSPPCFPELVDDPTSLALLAEAKAVRGKRSRWLTRGSAAASVCGSGSLSPSVPRKCFLPPRCGKSRQVLCFYGVVSVGEKSQIPFSLERSFCSVFLGWVFFFFFSGESGTAKGTVFPTYRVFEV